MMILALLVSAILLVIAAVHMLWGFGYWFPTGDEPRLVAAAVGARDVDRMPGPIPCGLVAGGLLMIIVVLWGRPSWLQGLIIYGAALVLGLRGIIAYLPLWRRMTPQEPFATYDRRYYGPLCLFLALALVLLQSVGF